MDRPDPPDWLDELDLHVGAPEAAMGTRSLELDRWFVVDQDWEPQRRAAARLLSDKREEVLVGTGTAAVDAAGRELLALIEDLVPAGPDTPPAPDDDLGDPLAAARLRVADDLCLLLPGASGWVLAAGCVCFPSYWRPLDRIGRPLADVHGLVPGYAGALSDRVEGFLGRLRPGRGVWRRNWSVHDVADLDLPGPVRAERPTPVPEGRWLRSERQALVRLPRTGVVAFTIRTQQVRLDALADRAGTCAALAAALRGWSDAQRAYKGGAVDAPLLDWLDAAASGADRVQHDATVPTAKSTSRSTAT